jgi:hypothetical protein
MRESFLKMKKKELKLQFYVVLKLMGLGIPFFIIPVASVLVPFSFNLSTKLGMDILPISFKNEEAS